MKHDNARYGSLNLEAQQDDISLITAAPTEDRPVLPSVRNCVDPCLVERHLFKVSLEKSHWHEVPTD